jgi:uncharacterized spore protein YtfJ
MDPQAVLTGAQDALTARRVFGEPIQADGAMIVPVAVIVGGGGGGSRGHDEGGVGYGLKARPAGVFVVKNGDARWRPAVNINLIIAGGQLVALAGLLTLKAYLQRSRKPA